MRDVTLRPSGGIKLRRAPVEPPEARQPAVVPHFGLALQIDQKQLEQSVQVVIVDGECPIHIGLAQCQVGVDDEFARQGPRMKPHGDGGGGCFSVMH